MAKSLKPPKIQNLLQLIRKYAKDGKYVETEHCLIRRVERGVIRQEIRYILENGSLEPAKDQFKEEFNSWNYSIKGKTVDDRIIRIIVRILDDGMLLITAILLNVEGS